MLGRYALYQELAAGGIGSVCLARMRSEAGFSRIMAVKRLHPHHAKDPFFVTMFLDEARMAARVRHPNVVAVLDVVSADDELFLVMEYVAGESLGKLLAAARERGGRIEPAIAVAIMSGVLEGLHAAHLATNERGVPLQIVHRDVSPQNVLVGVDGVPRVVDFGIAKAVGRVQESTQAGQIKGKLVYMPPEQFADGKLVDRRSDVWAASVLLWEMLVGRQLFPETPDALRYLAGAEEITPPSAHGAPDVLDAVVMRGLARRQDERFQTAREMLVAMERLVTPAPARRVAQWMQKLARDALNKRAALVEEIEAEASRMSAAMAVDRSRTPDEVIGAPANPQANETSLSSGDAFVEPVVMVPAGRRRTLGIWVVLALVVGGVGMARYQGAIRSRILAKRGTSTGDVEPPRAAVSTLPVPSPAETASEAHPAATVAPAAPSTSAPPAPVVASATKPRRPPPTRPPAHVTPTRAPSAPTVPPAGTGDPLDLKSRE
ncbi:MAG TPA: protein kinase [Labilithrix sp.]|nr:protein kinase [Labilithrix sp.]